MAFRWLTDLVWRDMWTSSETCLGHSSCAGTEGYIIPVECCLLDIMMHAILKGMKQAICLASECHNSCAFTADPEHLSQITIAGFWLQPLCILCSARNDTPQASYSIMWRICSAFGKHLKDGRWSEQLKPTITFQLNSLALKCIVHLKLQRAVNAPGESAA